METINGSYTFTDIPVGEYHVQFSQDQKTFVCAEIGHQGGTTLMVTTGQTAIVGTFTYIDHSVIRAQNVTLSKVGDDRARVTVDLYPLFGQDIGGILHNSWQLRYTLIKDGVALGMSNGPTWFYVSQLPPGIEIGYTTLPTVGDHYQTTFEFALPHMMIAPTLENPNPPIGVPAGTYQVRLQLVEVGDDIPTSDIIRSDIMSVNSLVYAATYPPAPDPDPVPPPPPPPPPVSPSRR